MSKRPTRRAPHMERYTEILRHGRGHYSLRLKVDHQSFSVGHSFGMSRAEALLLSDMLCIALDRLVTHERFQQPEKGNKP